MGVAIPQLAPASQDRVSGSQVIDGSVLIDGHSSGSNPGRVLNRTPGSAGNRKTFTWSGWVKRTSYGGSYEPTLFSASAGSSNPRAAFRFTTGNALSVGINPTGSSWSFLTTSAVFRDIGWYHVVMLVDTTQSTESDRTKIYVNGVQQTNFSSSYQWGSIRVSNS